MQFKKSILGSLITFAVATSANVVANEVSGDSSLLKEAKGSVSSKKSTNSYIVQLKGDPGIAQAQNIGELMPSNQLVAVAGNNYNAKTPAMQAYTAKLKAKQEKVASDIGSIKINNSFKHTFNGFSAYLTSEQKAQLESHPDVVKVWADEMQKVTTSNTPEFLGLTGPGGQHTMDIKGEDVIIGVLDTGIVPEHPSFSDTEGYSDPAELGWTGTCDAGEEAEAGTFTCNNKLIGARYFKDTFETVYDIQTELGEFISPRDADGHGSHTASTAGGNAGVAANIQGFDAGAVSGIAPRARIAAYKVCWNSDYVNPDGGDEAGCFPSDSMAAIDQAILDGVDVINFSIGGSRTDLTTPGASAKLRATQAGVFVAVSAGNSGPDTETVGTPAPWVTSVAASTYNGTSIIVGNELVVNDGESSMLSVPSGFAPAADGLSGELALASAIEACDEDGALEDLTGKVALIARGSCAFTEKFINAQDAGATAVVLYTYDGTTPFEMGGSDPAVAIPGSMVSFADGQALTASIGEGSTTVTFGSESFSGPAVETGNTIALFSSRGPNTASYDIIKPDITAPGVRILAATTNTPMFGAQDQEFAYLQGTSMSSPHIAGMAALFKESHSNWSPAQIKSALMTTARQDLTKEDGTTPADPFDFGAGHAQPVNAMDPGLTFDANVADYYAFLCGIDEADFVAANASEGVDCDSLAGAGFSTDPSQLNIASIGVAELLLPETVSRTVTDVSGNASVYTATIEAPEGIEVSLATYDSEGQETEGSTLEVAANGKASFALTFTKTEESVLNEWKYGSITWEDGNGHVVRSPIAVKALADVKAVVPKTISSELSRGRLSFPVQMLYSGETSYEFAGLVAPFGSSRTVSQDPDSDFSFNEAGLGTHFFHIPEGTQVARFSLTEGLINQAGTDLDLYVYRCDEWLCTQIETSLNGGSEEDVILVNPEPRADIGVGNVYLVWVHGYSLAGAETVDYTMPVWVADSADSDTRIISSKRAIEGRFNNVTLMNRNLGEGLFMGAITFFDDEGEAQGTTVLEISN